MNKSFKQNRTYIHLIGVAPAQARVIFDWSCLLIDVDEREQKPATEITSKTIFFSVLDSQTGEFTTPE